jgi:hypothetical protein
MVARAIGGRGVEALCLGTGEHAGKYTAAHQTCAAFAYDTAGRVDDPPNYGEETRAVYAAQAAERHPNGAPKYAPDGTMLDAKGNRSIFDDIAD